MSKRSRSPTPLEAYSDSPELREFLQQKRLNFTGRNFVFDAIKQFINRYSRGYFTLVGYPGMGKSAILVQLLDFYPDLIFYTLELRENSSTSPLEALCHHLIDRYQLTDIPPLDSPQSNGWLFSILLQKISDNLTADQRLIIAIDAIDRVDLKSQPIGSNLLYLPRYLPENIYFILSRRPYLKRQSGLLSETPTQILDLKDYPQENQQDIQAYLQQFSPHPQLQTYFHQWQLEPNPGLELLAKLSENNFKYLSEIIAVLTSDLSTPITPVDSISPEPLILYYQSLWQQMTQGNPTELQTKIIAALTQAENGITSDAIASGGAKPIAQQIHEDEYDIELILESWVEVLQTKTHEDQTFYRFYHSNFAKFLQSQII